MIEPVHRTVSVIKEDLEDSPGTASKRLAEYRDCPAYVLLGSPGAGKTTTFRQEADFHENGEYISARDFIALDGPNLSDKLLFIDGLDEIRAGASDMRTPFDKVRAKLQELGCPNFRLSCRTGYWFGTHDRNKMAQLGKEILPLRLDALTQDGILEILHRNKKPPNGTPEEFVEQARQHGLEALLENPLNLLLLADSVSERGDWPGSRRDAYENAYKTLLFEENDEHRISEASQYSPDASLKIAGRLCAVQLLAGCAGYTLPIGLPDKNYPALEQVSPGNKALQIARNTRVFTPTGEPNRITPVHQHIAEFLAGRYLAEEIKRGFSANRIFALMSGADKVVVPTFQGLATWCAAYSSLVRKKLIASNPMEVVLSGDSGFFDVEEKRQLLHALREKARDNPRSISVVRQNTHLRGLASRDLHEEIKEILTEPVHSESEHSFRYLVLKALHGSSATPEFPDTLLRIIRDDKSWPANQFVALHVLVQIKSSNADTVEHLKQLLAEVRDGIVKDFQGRLLDTLLVTLFPHHISANETLDCLMDSGQPSTAGFHTSWADRFVKQLNPEQLTNILNKLVIRVDEARQPNLSQASFKPFRTFLAILQGLFSPAPNRAISLLDLRHWLETAWCSEIQHTVSSSFAQIASSVHDWLRLQPDKHREIFENGVKEWSNRKNFKLLAHETGNWLFGLEPAPDFWSWCLDLAIRSKNPKAAEFYLRQIVGALSKEGDEINLSLDDVRARIVKYPKLEKTFEAMLERLSPKNHLEELEARQRRMAMDLHEREQLHQNWIAAVETHEIELLENRGPLGLLHNLALAYFGGFYDVEGDQPLERIYNLLDNNDYLVQVTLEAFKKAISREDVPSVSEIIRYAKRGQPHPLALPCMAGLEETGASALTDQQIHRALAFHYFVDYALPGEVSPPWYESLLIERPELVSKILIRRVRFQMRKREEFLTDSYELAFSSNHVKVASLTALPLLKSFPIRCTNQQLHALGHLLAAALLHCKHKDLKKLLKEKLAENKTKSMNIGQHVYWLATRFLISPQAYYRQLESYLRGNDRRTRHFAEFACQSSNSPEWNGLLKGKCLVPLVQLLGSSFRHISLDEGVAWNSPPMAASGLIHKLIGHLANDSSPTATETLDHLVADNSLTQWRIYLQDATDEQRSLRRQSEFTHCGVDELLQTLDEKRPANMDDLVVLLLEDFDEMGKKIRDGSTNDWHQYWNQSPEWKPKVEGDCRDAFLSDLQEKLMPLDIKANREASHADNTRADIQVSYKNLSLPIEVKKSHSKDLWKGIRGQLIPKYSRDPGADGRGIYLVFWFGEDSPRNPETKTHPTNPDELRRQLENFLTPEEADKVSIHVIDVAQPQGKTPFGLS